MPVKFKNNAVTTTATTTSLGATSITVVDGSKLPELSAGEYTYIRLGTDVTNEVVKVTARTAHVLTCVATQAGWAIGTDVIGTVTQEALDEMIQQEADGNIVADLELQDYKETRTTPSSSSGTLTLDISTSNVFEVTLTENVTTLTISNPASSGKACSFTLILKQDGTGSWTFAFPASIKWAGGTAPTLTTTASAIDLLTFITTDAGTVWYGFSAGADFS